MTNVPMGLSHLSKKWRKRYIRSVVIESEIDSTKTIIHILQFFEKGNLTTYLTSYDGLTLSYIDTEIKNNDLVFHIGVYEEDVKQYAHRKTLCHKNHNDGRKKSVQLNLGVTNARIILKLILNRWKEKGYIFDNIFVDSRETGAIFNNKIVSRDNDEKEKLAHYIPLQRIYKQIEVQEKCE